MTRTVLEDRGLLIAKLLAGSWRSSPPPLVLTVGEIIEVGPYLLRAGAGPLGWWRLRNTSISTTKTGAELRQSYRLSTLRSHINASRVDEVISHLHASGIEPVLIKGWAVALQYLELGLRPYGDIDLCVRDDQYEAATQALTDLRGDGARVDLHRGFEKFGGDDFEKIFARSRLVRCDNSEVRIPGPEDHFRIICFHLLREGAWRPLWLCDVANLLESRSKEFNWEISLGGKRKAGPVVCAIKLTQQLLGASLEGVPEKVTERSIPRWVGAAVLREWGSEVPSMKRRHMRNIDAHLRQPFNLGQALRDRWPNPIEATTTMNAPFNAFPRLPFQLLNCLTRTATLLKRDPKKEVSFF